MKQTVVVFVFSLLTLNAFAQGGRKLIFPNIDGWHVVNENEEVSFRIRANRDSAFFSIEGAQDTGIEFDSLGNFRWKPSFDFADRVDLSRELTVFFEARWHDGGRVREQVTFTVNHVNRPPVVEDLPVFYVRQATSNTYQIPQEYVYDPDGDPLVFQAMQHQMPEGSELTSQGVLRWTPSRSQFSALRSNPLFLEFIVQDQPSKAETKGKIKIAQTQLDLPPELLIVPVDTLVSIKEDETLNLKIYLSDPNGDDNIRSAGFVSNDTRVPDAALKQNTPLQYEFLWTPGYEFTDDVQKKLAIELTFFAIDKSNNRTQRRIRVIVNDAENLEKKDAHLFGKYRSNLVEAFILIQQLDDNQKKLNVEYKKARKGKKNRSILNASLGAVTGITPVVIDKQDQSKIVSGIGGTTVLTLGTLEATEVIGRSKDRILDLLKSSIDIRNKIQAAGDEFARKYALKSSRRNSEFDKDIEKLRATLSDQRIILLELDSHSRNPSKITDKDIKDVFVDYEAEMR